MPEKKELQTGNCSGAKDNLKVAVPYTIEAERMWGNLNNSGQVTVICRHYANGECVAGEPWTPEFVISRIMLGKNFIDGLPDCTKRENPFVNWQVV